MQDSKTDTDKTLLERLTLAIKSVLQPAEPVIEEKSADPGTLIYKDKGGTYHLVTRFSNKFRDDDLPKPEIISDASHKKFVKMVELGAVEPPELWLWHEPQWRWGEGEWVAYDETSGFAVSSHRVFPEFNDLAELLAQKDDVGVSHGMPWWSVYRSEADDTVITGHITQEVSPLPMWAAANKLTSIYVSKENEIMENKGIPFETKRLLTEQWGVPADMLDRLEAFNAQDAEKAIAEGRDSKEVGQVEPTATDAPAVEPTTPEVEVAPAAPVTVEIPDELKEIMTETMAAVIALTGQVAQLKKEISEIKKTEDEKIAAKAASTPMAGVLDLMRKSISAVGSEDTAVDGRTKLAKSGPVQAPEQPAGASAFGVPTFLDNVISRQAGGNN